jgi:small subunit ribosomal protein S14
MAKLSSINKNNSRIRKSTSDYEKRLKLKSTIMDKKVPLAERFKAAIKLASLRRNGAKTRVRNRCELTGRARGYYRKFRLSRICLRNLAGNGSLPGVIKASW